MSTTPATTSSPLSLLVLGRGSDLHSEHGVECPGDRVLVLGHRYRRNEVIALTDTTGNSFKFARQAAVRPDAPYIVFRGVHFMAGVAAQAGTVLDRMLALPGEIAKD